jgi:hypothetical protein
MQLSEHDLRQLDDQRLLALPLAGLQTLSLKLLLPAARLCTRIAGLKMYPAK